MPATSKKVPTEASALATWLSFASEVGSSVYWGYIGIMEKKMEATIVYWGYIGIMEKKMETTIVYWILERRGLGLCVASSSESGGICSCMHSVPECAGALGGKPQ